MKDSSWKARSNCNFRRRVGFVNSCHHLILPLCKGNCILCSKSQYIYSQIVLHYIHHQIFSVKMFISTMELLRKVTSLLWLGMNRFLLGWHISCVTALLKYFQTFKYSVVINKTGAQLFLYCLYKGYNSPHHTWC